MASDPSGHKFNVGDYIRCLSSHQPGKQLTKDHIYKVRRCSERTVMIEKDDAGVLNGWSIDNFCLIDIDSLSALERAFYDIPRKSKK
jgi:hypothetical protein